MSRITAAIAMLGAFVLSTPPTIIDIKITGRVVDGQTGAGLAGATVRLHKVGKLGLDVPTTSSDPDGFFAFNEVTVGLWTVAANFTGYRSGLSGTTALGDQPITTEIVADDRLKNVVVQMFKLATVAGRVTDARGRAIANADVWSVSKRWAQGRLVPIAATLARTDARGEYQATIHTPGEYVFGV